MMMIFNGFQRILIPSNFTAAADEETLRTAHLVATLSVLGFVLTIFYSLAWALVMPQYLWRLIFAPVALVATGLPIFLVRSGRVRAASLVFAGGIWLLVTLVTPSAGGTRSPFFGLYTLIVFFAALVSGWRTAVVFATLSIASGLGMVILDQQGFIPLPLATPSSAYLTQIVIMVALTGTAYFAVRRSDDALGRARHELAERKRIEAALRASEERFRLISSVTSDYTFSSHFNAQGELVHMLLSGAFEAITGYSPDEFNAIGGWRATIYAADQPQDESDMAALRRNQPVVTEVRIIRKGGEIRWVRVYAHPVWDAEHNRLVGINGAVQDITERRHADELLSKERQLLRAVIDHLPDNIFVKDREGKFILNNAESMRILGVHRQDDLLGKTDVDFFPREQAEAWLAEHKNIMDSGITILTEEVFQPWNQNERRWVVSSHIPLHDEHGGIVGLVGINRDISERKRVEQDLIESEERYRIISEMIGDYAFAYNVNPNGSLEPVWITEDSFSRISGYTWGEIGATFSLYHPDDAQRVQDDVAQTIRGDAASGEYRIITKDGHTRWLHIRRRVLRDDKTNRVIRFYGAAEDVTERKKAEEALRRSEALLRALLDATTDVAFLMSPDGVFLTLNKTMAESYGLPVEEVVGQSAFDRIPADLREKRRQQFRTVLQTKKPTRWEDANGTDIWDNSVYPVLSQSGEVEAFAVYSRDITEQKRLEAELQRYNTQLEAIVEERTIQLRRAKEQIEIILNNTSDAIALTQSNGDVQTTNPAFAQTFGASVSQSIERILAALATDEQVTSVGNALMHVIWDNENQRVEAQITSMDGKDRDIDLAFIPVMMGGESPENGILVSAHDITAVKEIERFKARFVADALHDMATPITGLSTRLYLLKRSPAKLEEHVRALENQVDHLRDLLMDLRTLSQIDRGHLELSRETCPIQEPLRRILDTYEPVALSRQQTISLTIEPFVPLLRLDRRLFERALANLVSNAVKYSEDGKTIAIEACMVEDKLEIAVIDHGVGISSADLPHIFERFYRTEHARRSEISGTGLGLAIVKDIIELHGGRVTAESTPGLGSTFRIILPVNS